MADLTKPGVLIPIMEERSGKVPKPCFVKSVELTPRHLDFLKSLKVMSTPDPIHRLPMEAYGMEKLDSGNEGKYLHRPVSAIGFMFGKVSQAIGP